MAIIIPPPAGKRNIKNIDEEKISKLIIYFRKEIDISNPDGYSIFLNTVKKANALGIFDEIFIVKGKDVDELLEFEKEYQAATINEIKYLKRETYILKNSIIQLLNITKNLREKLEKIAEKSEIKIK